MCGRFALISPVEDIRARLIFSQTPNLQPRYNIAPTQPIRVLRAGLSGTVQMGVVTWGLIPEWMRAEQIPQQRPQHNARSETVQEKPSFRDGFKRRRCLIPANVFYEWKQKTRQAYLVKHAADDLFMMAGIWSHWQGKDGSEIESAAILTCAANTRLTSIHHRMPVMIGEADWQDWLTTPEQESGRLSPLLKPAPEDSFTAYPISDKVNKLAHDDATLWEPVSETEKPQMDLF